MAIDEADEDLEDKEADLSILHKGCGEQPVQEGAGKCREHITALETHRDLQASKKKGGNVTVSLGGVKTHQERGYASTEDYVQLELFLNHPRGEGPRAQLRHASSWDPTGLVGFGHSCGDGDMFIPGGGTSGALSVSVDSCSPCHGEKKQMVKSK